MKLKDTLKLLRYTQTPQLNLVITILFGICALVTAIPSVNGMMGAFWANYLPMYFIGQITTVTFSDMMQSSEKFKKIVTRNCALLLAIANVLGYILFGVIRTVLSYAMGMEEYVGSFLIAYMIFQILYILYGTVIYKNVKLGILLMAPVFLLIIFASYDGGPASVFSKWAAMADVKFFLILTAIVCLLSPLLYYVMSTLLYKVSYSEGMIKRAERQETV